MNLVPLPKNCNGHAGFCGSATAWNGHRWRRKSVGYAPPARMLAWNGIPMPAAITEVGTSAWTAGRMSKRTNICLQCRKVFVVPKDYDWYCSPKCFKLYNKPPTRVPRKGKKKGGH